LQSGIPKNISRLRRLDSQRVVKHFLRVQIPLNLLQPRQILPVVHILCLGPIQQRIRIVDVHAPLRAVQPVGEGLDPAVEKVKPIRRVGTPRRVVKLVEEEVTLGVAVGVGCGGCWDPRDGGVCAAVKVDDDVPGAGVGLGFLDPVVGDVLEDGGWERGGDQALGVECLALGVVHVSNMNKGLTGSGGIR